MNENEYRLSFIKNFEQFKEKLNHNELRVYGIEFPLRTSRNRVDLVIENTENKNLMILEFKRDKIDHSAIDQVKSYKEETRKQLYRKKSVCGLVAPDFSEWTIEEAKKQKMLLVQFDGKNMRIL